MIFAGDMLNRLAGARLPAAYGGMIVMIIGAAHEAAELVIQATQGEVGMRRTQARHELYGVSRRYRLFLRSDFR